MNGEKIAKLGIKRDPEVLYYVKNGDVWCTPRKKPGEPKGKATKVASAGIEMDYSKYLYYLDGDGDVARKPRVLGTTRAATVDEDLGPDQEDDDVVVESDAGFEQQVSGELDVLIADGPDKKTQTNDVEERSDAPVTATEKQRSPLVEQPEANSADSEVSSDTAAAAPSGTPSPINNPQRPDSAGFPDVACVLTRDVHPGEHCLRVDDYAQALAAVMQAARGEFCFAIFGHWGRGKTFLLQRLAAFLPQSYRPVWFSAWKYRTRPEIWIHLYETIARASRVDGTWKSKPRAVRAFLVRHGAWPVVVSLFALAISILGLGVLPVLIGAVGLVTILKAYAFVRWAAKLPPFLFSVPRHSDKLGMQATIGEDLTALLKGWMPSDATRQYSSGLPSRLWLFPYVLAVVSLVGAAWVGFHPGDFAWLKLHPPTEVRWVAVTILGSLGVFLPIWVVYAGRAPQQLALIIDDLDRCDPETMLELIESLKLLLEDPEVSARVQVFMLVDEDALHQAIANRYIDVRRVETSNILDSQETQLARAVDETIEKLFVAHLRLPPLEKHELEELMAAYVRQPGLRAQLTPAQLAKVDADATATRVRASTVSEPSTEPDAAADPAKTAGRSQATDLADLVFTSEERAVLRDAAAKMVVRDGRQVGPRAVRTFLVRYQLAKFLLARRDTSCSPQLLVQALLAPSGQYVGMPDLNAVVAQVSRATH
jgi:hypothetical protein